MVAIRKKKSKRWLSKVNRSVPITSTKRLVLGELPQLFEHELLAHVEMIQEHLSPNTWEIVEVEVLEKASVR